MTQIRPERTLQLSGRVVAGRGIASHQIRESLQEISSTLRQQIHPGTLNVVLNRPVMLSPETATHFPTHRRLVWPAAIAGVPVWIYRWGSAPVHLAELISSTNLRHTLGASDGSIVQLSVATHHVVPLTIRQQLGWMIVWKYREAWYYKGESYNRRVKSWNGRFRQYQPMK